MSKEVIKIYNKAMNYYQIGEYKKALELCEAGISKDLTNTALLNLKGLLYYLNGELKQAIALWNINKDYNNDEIAKIYLKDSKGDDVKLSIFNEAELNIKELNIDEAIKKLKICAQSDFNSINVNNCIATCYIKKGKYDLAKEYNEKALKIDIRNIYSLNIKKEILSITRNPKDEFKQKTLIMISVSTIIIIVFIGILIGNLNKDIDQLVATDNELNQQVDNVVNNEVDHEDIKEQVEEEMKEEVSLSNDEIKSIYLDGTEYFENKEFDKAIEVLSSAINNINENYLNQHILFLLASAYDNNKMIENGIKYYEDYVNKYSQGSYIEETYYKLSILYQEENNLDKSKEYANLLKINYPGSIYINTIIKDIISN